MTDLILVTAEVNAMAAKLNAYGTISMMRQPIIMIMESRLSLWRWSLGGQDLVALVTGYNWFNTSQNYSDRVYDSSTDELIWKKLFIII